MQNRISNLVSEMGGKAFTSWTCCQKHPLLNTSDIKHPLSMLACCQPHKQAKTILSNTLAATHNKPAVWFNIIRSLLMKTCLVDWFTLINSALCVPAAKYMGHIKLVVRDLIHLALWLRPTQITGTFWAWTRPEPLPFACRALVCRQAGPEWEGSCLSP